MAASGDETRHRDPARGIITRRTFVKTALATGGSVALPLTGAGRRLLGGRTGSAAAADPTPGPLTRWGGPFFLATGFTDPSTGRKHNLYETAAAICDRVIPADELGPGASAAGAANYIDIFMAAFQADLLSSGLVNTSPIFLRGPFSGRWPFGDARTGQPGTRDAPDAFENSRGEIQFLDLTPAQALAWYLRLYGSGPGPLPSWASRIWLRQAEVNEGATATTPIIPGAQDLRSLYRKGLSSFDDWSRQNFGTPFARASAPEQDVLLALASNQVLGAASENGLPSLPSPLPNPVPPAPAASLFGVIVLHTIQGTYCLPEYAGLSDKALGGGVTWASIDYDGDTQPLGNSIYDAALDENQPPEPQNRFTNRGFGFPPGESTNPAGAFTPTGAYREYRAVSYPEPGSRTTGAASSEFAELTAALRRAGAHVVELAKR